MRRRHHKWLLANDLRPAVGKDDRPRLLVNRLAPPVAERDYCSFGCAPVASSTGGSFGPPCNRSVCPSVQMAMSPAFQEQVPTPPAPPTPPTPPTPGRIVIGQPGGGFTTIEVPNRPLSAREVQALQQRGRELSRQLTSANNRRNQLANALEDAEGVNRQGIEQRIAQLDQRIMTIEQDIAQNGRLLASAPPSSLPVSSETRGASGAPLGLNPGQITGISIVGTIFVLFPIAIAMARNIWRRGSYREAAPASGESAQRMERLEQA